MIYFFDGVDSVGKSYISSRFHQQNSPSVLIKPSDFRTSKDESWTMVWMKILLVCRSRYRGQIVICDRSPLSEIVYNPSLNSLQISILRRMIHSSDTVFIVKRSYDEYIEISSRKSHIDSYDCLSREEFYRIQNLFMRFLSKKNFIVFPNLN